MTPGSSNIKLPVFSGKRERLERRGVNRLFWAITIFLQYLIFSNQLGGVAYEKTMEPMRICRIGIAAGR